MARSRLVTVGRTVRGGSKRATDWIASAADTARTSLAAATTVLDQIFPFEEPATIIRTRGSLWVDSDQMAATEFPFGAMGMMVASDEAAAVGVSAFPDPYNTASFEFFVHQFWAAHLDFGSAIGFDSSAGERYDFDSKAMRKVDAGKTVGVVLTNNSATDGAVFLLSFRMLIKLHG